MTDGRAASPARMVIRAPNWLGDAVLALPAMTAIRRRFPGAHLTVAAAPSVAALFREDTDVVPDAVMELSGSSRAVVAALAGGRFDLGVLFPNSFRSAWQLWRAGIPGRWGFATSGRGPLLTTRSPRARGVMHQSDYYRALVTGLAVPPVADNPRLAPSAASRARAAALLEDSHVAPAARLVCLAPGAAYGSAKQWPTDRMAALAARLIREHDATCVIVGAGHDREAARAIESWLRSNAPDVLARAIDLVGRTTLGALVGLAAQSAVFVSNDSGAMHVAAALGRPVVAIFGPTDERATAPLGPHTLVRHDVWCRPCLLRACPIDHRCLRGIGAPAVAAAAAQYFPT